MIDKDRFTLWFGPYSTPRFRYGNVVMDEVRGEVKIVGLTNARIPWPVGKRGRAKSLVVYAALLRAVQVESNQAVCHWWGVTPQTVTKWRKSLGVRPTTLGTSRLRIAYGHEESIMNGLRKSWLKAKDPTRRAKIAASKRGKKRPSHVIEAVRRAHLGVSPSTDARRRMSEAHKRRGTRPPKAGKTWTTQHDALLSTHAPSDVARLTGRTIKAVYSRRRKLGIPDGRLRK